MAGDSNLMLAALGQVSGEKVRTLILKKERKNKAPQKDMHDAFCNHARKEKKSTTLSLPCGFHVDSDSLDQLPTPAHVLSLALSPR